MSLPLSLLLQNGSTFVEHGADLYPIIGFVIVTLLALIAWGMQTLISLVKERMDEIRNMLDEHLKSDNEHRLEIEKRFNQHDVRISIAEHELGLPSQDGHGT